MIALRLVVPSRMPFMRVRGSPGAMLVVTRAQARHARVGCSTQWARRVVPALQRADNARAAGPEPPAEGTPSVAALPIELLDRKHPQFWSSFSHQAKEPRRCLKQPSTRARVVRPRLESSPRALLLQRNV